MIDRAHDLPIPKQAEAPNISRGSVYYLPRPVPPKDLALMQRLDQAASVVSLRRFANAACWLPMQDRPPACQNANAADGDRGALPPSAHHPTRARPQDLSVSAARYRDHASEPGLGDGHHLHPDGARLRLSARGAGLATRRVLSWRLSITMEAAFCVATLEDALARHGKPEIFSRSSPARRSPACSPTTASPSVWTAGAPGGTTCSSSGCGPASNTRRFICGPTRTSAKLVPRSADTYRSTAHRRGRLDASARRVHPEDHRTVIGECCERSKPRAELNSQPLKAFRSGAPCRGADIGFNSDSLSVDRRSTRH